MSKLNSWQNTQQNKQVIRTNIDGNREKWCYGCKKWLPVEKFGRKRSNKLSLNSRCFECANKQKGYRLKKKLIEKSGPFENYVEPEDKTGLKQCVGTEKEFGCGRYYPATTDFFHKQKGMPDGLTKRCKKCIDNGLWGNIQVDTYNPGFLQQPRINFRRLRKQ
jgi:hypothetical protein